MPLREYFYSFAFLLMGTKWDQWAIVVLPVPHWVRDTVQNWKTATARDGYQSVESSVHKYGKQPRLKRPTIVP